MHFFTHSDNHFNDLSSYFGHQPKDYGGSNSGSPLEKVMAMWLISFTVL